MANPEVSIVLLTHNHAAFIQQCLESAISQQTSFKFEIIIGDDASTDGTSLICERLAEQNPEIITWLKREKNLGLGENLIQTLALARGNFITFQEGDDYYTDPLKLQTQYDFLKHHPEFNACTHQVQVLNGITTKNLLASPKEIYNLSDTETGRLFHTNSWFIRKNTLPAFQKYHTHWLCWDILLEQKILELGPVFFIDKTFSVWRKHPDGNSVKWPLQEQYHAFKNLYVTLLNQAKARKNKPLINHYTLTLHNCHRIFLFEIARREKRTHLSSFLNYSISQLLNLKIEPLFIYRLWRTIYKPVVR